MPRAPEATGRVLDRRYELHALVGEGTFGRVYRGRDRRLDRTVAVKLIKPWWAEDPAWAQKFEREARLLARLSDPGIVQIFDVGQTRESLYYVAEYVDGESLSSLLERGPLQVEEAGDLAEQLCRALGRAHAERVVHRDIKPANVLISSSGQVKLADFGIARLAEGSTGASAGEVIGTPRYMAPEQARGRPTSPATDVYSVGVVLYEMLAGTPPFAADSPIELALSHVQDPPPSLPATVPAELRQVVERALAKDPADRYRDARGMASALVHARGGPAASPRRPPILRRDTRRSEPEPTRVAPKLTPRKNVDPSARRRSVALLGLAFLVLAGMILGAVLLAPPGRVRVPRLAGLTRGEVLARLGHRPLRTSFAMRFDSAPAGTAIAQTPPPGASVTDGSTVRIVVSAGPPPVMVPRLAGQPSSSASSILSSLGLGVAITEVPAPGVQPGVVTAQSPGAGRYLKPHGTVALTVAEQPRWRQLTSFSGTDGGASAPFRIRGDQWRIVYRMSFVGACSLIFFCDGPSAQIVRSGSSVEELGMSDGGSQTEVVRSGPGVYQVRIAPGSDTTRWSMQVEDYY